MHAALALVRRELGPDAAVLHTREVRRSRWLGLLPGQRQIEVTASRGINVPSRLPARVQKPKPAVVEPPPPKEAPARAPAEARLTHQVQGQLSTLQAMVKDLCRHSKGAGHNDWPDRVDRAWWKGLTDFIQGNNL